MCIRDRHKSLWLTEANPISNSVPSLVNAILQRLWIIVLENLKVSAMSAVLAIDVVSNLVLVLLLLSSVDDASSLPRVLLGIEHENMLSISHGLATKILDCISGIKGWLVIKDTLAVIQPSGLVKSRGSGRWLDFRRHLEPAKHGAVLPGPLSESIVSVDFRI